MKSDFPFFKKHPDLVYLDSAATTQKPQVVLTALQNYYENQNANPDRALYDLGYEATKLHTECRQTVADFLNATPEQIIFTSGCTESLNLVALSFSLKPNDEILVSVFEHHSNFIPWQQLAKRAGAQFKVFTSPEDFKSKLSSRTKIVAITAISNVTGVKLPVEQIVKRAHKVGAKVILDAAQAVAHFPLDVKRLDVDFLAFSGHKMYAPMGIGVLYVKNPAEFMPNFFGGGAISQVSEKQTVLADDVSRFEPGTRNLAGEVGLKAAVEWLVDKRKPFEVVQGLVQLAYDKLSGLPFVELISPRDAVGIVSFNLYRNHDRSPENLIHAHDVATILNDYNVCIRAGNHCAEPLMRHLGLSGCCRASFGLYNSASDVEKLVAAIQEAWEVLK